jgi:hypothetical protein
LIHFHPPKGCYWCDFYINQHLAYILERESEKSKGILDKLKKVENQTKVKARNFPRGSFLLGDFAYGVNFDAIFPIFNNFVLRLHVLAKTIHLYRVSAKIGVHQLCMNSTPKKTQSQNNLPQRGRLRRAKKAQHPRFRAN